MKPLAVTRTNRRTEREASRSESRPSGLARRRLAPNYRLFTSQTLAEHDAKDARGDSYAIPLGILKPNIYYKAHNFAPGPIRPELSRQEPRRLLSAGRRAMKATSSIFQSTFGRARRRRRFCRKGAARTGHFIGYAGFRMVEGGL